MTDQDSGPAAVADRPHLPPRVRFGKADTQEIPFLWAERGLCWLYEYRRQVFADMMLAVMETGFATSNRRNGSSGRP